MEIPDELLQRHIPTIVLLVGLPGSGKTTYAEQYKNNPQWVVISQDQLLKLDKCILMTQDAVANGKNVMIDRCNTTMAQRAHWVKIAKQYHVHAVCWILSTPVDECKRRASSRPEHPTLSRMSANRVISMLARTYTVPLLAEGFASVQMLK